MKKAIGLRQRQRLTAMRLVQGTAIELFERDGFDTTTIDAISAASGVSTATIYRHFGNKETIVLWDEFDGTIDAELAHRLVEQPPLEAFRDAAVAAYGQRDDTDLLLRRLKLVYGHPSILGVAAQAEATNRSELATALALVGGRKRPDIADDVTAAIALTALDVAFTRWQAADGEQPIANVIGETFAAAAERRRDDDLR